MNAAERTSKQIEKEQLKLNGLIVKRDEFTSNYQAQLDKMNESIDELTKKIELLKKREKSEKLTIVASLLNKRGISVDDLYNATTNKDFYGLQERLEKPSLDNTAESSVQENTVDTESTVDSENPVIEEDEFFDDKY